jgi:hypothetical protein
MRLTSGCRLWVRYISGWVIGKGISQPWFDDKRFVSHHVIEYYGLNLVDGYVLLTWKLSSNKRRCSTRFFLEEDNQPDFFLARIVFNTVLNEIAEYKQKLERSLANDIS